MNKVGRHPETSFKAWACRIDTHDAGAWHPVGEQKARGKRKEDPAGGMCGYFMQTYDRRDAAPLAPRIGALSGSKQPWVTEEGDL